MSFSKIPLVVIAGPTASGKTALSIEIAKRFNGEIISADSMQIYKYMDIGTAKPTEDEMGGIKHHMLDVVVPDEEFSVFLYSKQAKKHIDDIYKAGKLPIMVGGTGLYIDNVIENISLAETKEDGKIREQLKKEAEEKGYEYMHERLSEIDKEAAENIHPNNIRRVLRALEVYYQTGKSFTEQKENSKREKSPYKTIFFMPNWDRDVLYERINRRVDIMFEQGLLEEFDALTKKGYTHKLNSMQAIGYKELFKYNRGMCSLEEAKELIKKHSRNYAKRQLTWFKRNKNIILLDAQKDNVQEVCREHIENWIKQ